MFSTSAPTRSSARSTTSSAWSTNSPISPACRRPGWRATTSTDCVRQAMFLMRVGRPEIAIEDDLPSDPLWAEFDRRLISQALTNVLKNACEGIDALENRPREPGRIRVDLSASTPTVGARIAVSDNGKGFPDRRSTQADGALCDDARRGHRPRPADRHQDLRGSSAASVELLDGLHAAGRRLRRAGR